jgi:hypothetical protein
LLPHTDISKATLHCGDFADIYPRLAAESIDAIITDPPYESEFLHLYDLLGKAAKYLLKETGSLLTLAGQTYLPDVLMRLSKHLNYCWAICYLTPCPATEIWHRKIRCNWKPLLWFKLNDDIEEWHPDAVKSLLSEKDYDEWQQSESGMTDIIEHFTSPGDLILDPYMGTGTTGVVCLRLGRQFIGIEKSVDNVELARRRLADDQARNNSSKTNGI